MVVSSSAAFSCKALEVVELLFLNKRRTICVIWLTQIWKPHKFPVHVLRSAVQRKHNQNKASRKQKASCVCVCTAVLYLVTSSHFVSIGTTLCMLLFLVIPIKEVHSLPIPLQPTSCTAFHILHCAAAKKTCGDLILILDG